MRDRIWPLAPLLVVAYLPEHAVPFDQSGYVRTLHPTWFEHPLWIWMVHEVARNTRPNRALTRAVPNAPIAAFSFKPSNFPF